MHAILFFVLLPALLTCLSCSSENSNSLNPPDDPNSISIKLPPESSLPPVTDSVESQSVGVCNANWMSFLANDAKVLNCAGSLGVVFVFYGGYGARLSDSVAWANASISSLPQTSLPQKTYVFRGPNEVQYTSRHFKNSLLVSELQKLPSSLQIYLFAHSSGAFVADEFVFQAKKAGFGSRITAHILDGIYTQNLSSGLKKSVGVWAQKGSVQSLNAAAMRRFSQRKQIEVGTVGCNSNWCLHFGVVSKSPVGSLAADYQNGNRVSEYLQF